MAQNAFVDSLVTVLASQPRDTHRVSVLNQLTEQLRFNEYQRAIDYVNEAMRLADSLHFQRGLATAKIGYGEIQYHLGAYDLGMESALEAMELYRLVDDHDGIGRSLVSIGLVQHQLRQFDKSIESYRKAAEHYEVNHNIKGKIGALHNMSVSYSEVKDTVKAKQQLLENLETLKTTTYWGHLAATYNNLANLMDPVTEGDSAIKLYEVALSYKRKSNSPSKSSIGNTIMNIANVYLERRQYAAAEAQLKLADPLVMGSGELIRVQQLHALWGKLYYRTGRYKQSAEHFEKQTVVQDSIYQPQMAEQASRLEAAFQSERQQAEISLLNKEKLQAEATEKKDREEKVRWMWLTIGTSVAFLGSIVLLLIVVLRGRERNRIMKLLTQKNAEIKRQQQEIVLQNEALSLQNKRLEEVNNDKDGLIGIVAHDIRAPLNRSAALAELIASIGNLSAEQSRYVEMIKKVSDEGGRLIQDLLELNSYESNLLRVEWSQANLADVVEHSLHGFGKAAAEKSISIEWVRVDIMAQTDEKLLGRILDNLVSNAIKFTPKGKRIHLTLSDEGSMKWISIRDEGPGISVEDQKKMFQKFQRLAARPTGGETSTGLGLSIVKTLSVRIHAEVTFESSLGKGTTFKIGIPAKT